MASPIGDFEGTTDVDIRHHCMRALLRISDALTENEALELKLYCMHLVPQEARQELRRADDLFRVLMEQDKIDPENLDFFEEILERMGREDLIRDVLRPFQRPDREIPENPELQPGTSQEDASAGGATSDAYLIIHGQRRMIQETVDRHRRNLASLCGTRRSQVKFRGYKKGHSILVHFSIPRENTAVLRHMARHSDPRLVYMGVKSLQIDDEPAIKVADVQEALLHDTRRQHPVDDIDVGCSTTNKQQKAPKMWSRLSALNLFSDSLPLHLQAAESLEYQGFSYSLVQAQVQENQERERMRSKLTILKNRMKETLEKIRFLEERLQNLRTCGEYAEKAYLHFHDWSEYTGELLHGGWTADVATLTQLADGTQTARKGGGHSESETKDPWYITVDCGGNNFVSDWATHFVRVYDGSEKFKLQFGGQGSFEGQLQFLRRIFTDSEGHSIVADTGNRRVHKFTRHGEYVRHTHTGTTKEGIVVGPKRQLIQSAWYDKAATYPRVIKGL